jgi:hypothetical protein
MAKPFIHYQEKKGACYAAIYTPRWENGKKVNDIINLGRVIDKENGVFQSRKNGLFKYDLNTGITKIENYQEKSTIDKINGLIFGDIYSVYNVLDAEGYIKLFKSVFNESYENIIALTLYRLLNNRPSTDAIHWWNGTYAKILFPNANLQSARISEHIAKIGTDDIHYKFFSYYLKELYSTNNTCGILIDSTGLPNWINFSETRVNKHNGVVNSESRLIYVVDKDKKVPIYFRTVPGNIIDVSTLNKTISDLKSYNINVEVSILDAGYFSEENLDFLMKNQIGFVTRLASNKIYFKELVAENFENIYHMKNRVLCNGRLIYVLKKEFIIRNYKLYAYICIDHKRMSDEIFNLGVSSFGKKNISDDELEIERKNAGLFIIISSVDLNINDIIPFYYNRQTIEQIFDITKNNADILPLRCHNIDTYKGHLLLSFMATISYIIINNKFKTSKYNAMNAFSILHYLLCFNINGKFSINEPNRQMKDIFELLNIDIPLDFSSSLLEPQLCS